jgi:hypothetical protein
VRGWFSSVPWNSTHLEGGIRSHAARKRVTMACNCDSSLSLCRDAETAIIRGWVGHGVSSKGPVVVSSVILLTPSCEVKVPTKTVYQSNAVLVF